MGRKKGSKNINTNTAKNKNIININVNTPTKKKRGRPRKNESTTSTTPRNQQLSAGGAYNSRAPVFTAPPPPTQYISPPQPDNSNSLLSSFIASKLLNESSFPSRTNINYDEPSRMFSEPSRGETFNLRESIIPKVADTPMKSDIKPPPPPPQSKGPPPPPPPQPV